MKTTLLALGLASLLTAAPNVVIILADDLGYGDLSSYGSTSNRTPAIDSLAASGIRLSNFYASPVCSPTRASLMTGAYSWRVGLPRVLFPNDTIGINRSETTIAEYMRRLGYRTGLIGKWHLGDHYPLMPLQHGFDYYLGLPYSNDMIPPGYPPLPLIENDKVLQTISDGEQEYLTWIYTGYALAFIEQSHAAHQPFFLVLSHTSVHTPFHPRPWFLDRSINGSYGAEVEEIDASTGAVMDKLSELGLDSNTLVVFLSDNGGTRNGSNGRLRGYKASTYEGGVRVPAIFKWPGVIPANTRNSSIASVMDLLPTIVRLAGGDAQNLPFKALKIDGRDIMPVLRNQATLPPQPYFYFNTTNLRAVRYGDYKLDLIYGQLYDLARDPGEDINVAGAHPGVVSSLRSMASVMGRDLGTTFSTCGSGCRSPGY